MRDIRILLHNIRSVYNVGAIFRTADAIGVSKVYLSGYTPGPLDRFGRVRKDFAKCALGSETSVPSEHVDCMKTIKVLSKEGFQVVVLEQADTSIDYKKVKIGQKTLVICGNEVSGVEKKVVRNADIVAEIPMRGNKESLNVSVSAGIALFRWFDR